MDIENLTLKQIKEIAAIAGNLTGNDSGEYATFTPHIGKRCIVRTYASGVHFGEVVKQSGRMVEIKNCRRLWRWQADESISLSSVAVNGVRPNECKFPETVETQTILDALEIIPVSDKAAKSIDACKVAEQN